MPILLAWLLLLLHLATQLCLTLCDSVAHQAPQSVGFPRQEYWSGLPFPTPGDLPDPGIKPVSLESPALEAGALPLSHQGSLNASTN